MKNLFLFLILSFPFPGLADQVTQSEGIDHFLPLIQKAWNEGDVEAFIQLHDSESKMFKQWLDEEMKPKIQTGFKELQQKLGEITKATKGVYIAKKDRFVLKYTYENSGLIPGTIQTVKKDGKWFIQDWNIDGQGEKELKE